MIDDLEEGRLVKLVSTSAPRGTATWSSRLSRSGMPQLRTKMSTDEIYPVLITRDAAATIERTLHSLAEFPEVVVYDNGSTDGTIGLCGQFPNVKVMTGAFSGYGRTKNHAVSLARGDWVLSIDADEYLSEALLTELREIRLDDPSVAYAVERHNLFLGKDVRHAGLGNNWLVRLFNRRRCRFSDVLVHEKVIVPTDCTTLRLRGAVWHQACTDLDQILDKISRYSELNRVDGAPTRGVLNIWFRSAWSFFKSYVFKGGFLEGWRGIVIAHGDAMGTFFKHVKRYADKATATEKLELPK
jgi:glycosyltransferase involved in cell wall biosynthesis